MGQEDVYLYLKSVYPERKTTEEIAIALRITPLCARNTLKRMRRPKYSFITWEQKNRPYNREYVYQYKPEENTP